MTGRVGSRRRSRGPTQPSTGPAPHAGALSAPDCGHEVASATRSPPGPAPEHRTPRRAAPCVSANGRGTATGKAGRGQSRRNRDKTDRQIVPNNKALPLLDFHDLFHGHLFSFHSEHSFLRNISCSLGVDRWIRQRSAPSRPAHDHHPPE